MNKESPGVEVYVGVTPGPEVVYLNYPPPVFVRQVLLFKYYPTVYPP